MYSTSTGLPLHQRLAPCYGIPCTPRVPRRICHACCRDTQKLIPRQGVPIVGEKRYQEARLETFRWQRNRPKGSGAQHQERTSVRPHLCALVMPFFVGTRSLERFEKVGANSSLLGRFWTLCVYCVATPRCSIKVGPVVTF